MYFSSTTSMDVGRIWFSVTILFGTLEVKSVYIRLRQRVFLIPLDGMPVGPWQGRLDHQPLCGEGGGTQTRHERAAEIVPNGRITS